MTSNKRFRITPKHTVISLWYKLVNSQNGEPFMTTGANTVSVTTPAYVDKLLRAVKGAFNENGYLKGIPVGMLRVYPNKDTFDRRNNSGPDKTTPLISSFCVDRLGQTEDDAIIISVPSIQRAPTVDPLSTGRRHRPGSPPLNFKGGENADPEPPTLEVLLAETTRFASLGREYLEGAGIGKSGGMVLYIRDRCRQQIRFIKDMIDEQEGNIGLVLGQPGTGKSVTAYLTALALTRTPGHCVLWIHISRTVKSRFEFQVVVMHNGRRRYAVTDSIQVLNDFISEGEWEGSEPKRVIFLDGFVDGPELQLVLDEAIMWMIHDRELNRLIVSSSMGSSIVLSNETRLTIRQVVFSQYSWSFAEYEAAMQDDAFRRDVLPVLAPENETEVQSYLEEKFYYAGGSARFMFQVSLKTVKDYLDHDIKAALQGNCGPTVSGIL